MADLLFTGWTDRPTRNGFSPDESSPAIDESSLAHAEPGEARASNLVLIGVELARKDEPSAEQNNRHLFGFRLKPHQIIRTLSNEIMGSVDYLISHR